MGAQHPYTARTPTFGLHTTLSEASELAKADVVVVAAVVEQTYFAACFYIRSRFAALTSARAAREEEMYTWCTLSLSLPTSHTPSLRTCTGCVKTSVPDDVSHIDRDVKANAGFKGKRGHYAQLRDKLSGQRSAYLTLNSATDYENARQWRTLNARSAFFLSLSLTPPPSHSSHFAISSLGPLCPTPRTKAAVVKIALLKQQSRINPTMRRNSRLLYAKIAKRIKCRIRKYRDRKTIAILRTQRRDT